MAQINMLEVISESIMENMDSVMCHDKEYKKAQDNVNKIVERLKSAGLTEEQDILVENLIAELGACSMIGHSIAYRQGMKNCASLLWELRQ